jgi:hypothetical protein
VIVVIVPKLSICNHLRKYFAKWSSHAARSLATIIITLNILPINDWWWIHRLLQRLLRILSHETQTFWQE